MIQQLQVKEALPSPGNKVAVTASVLWHLEELCPNPLTSEETIDRRIINDNQSQFNEFIDRDTHKLGPCGLCRSTAFPRPIPAGAAGGSRQEQLPPRQQGDQ